MSDTVVVMDKGRIQQIGTPEDIYNEPKNAFVADFIGESNIIDGVMLQDNLVQMYGKKFPCLDGGFAENEPFPRIFQTRQINRKTGQYFGPFSHIGSMYTILDFIKRIYHPRPCRMMITPESISSGRHKPCLEYHIKNCGGCCIGRQSREDYLANIAAARERLFHGIYPKH